jgi:hypothetical protein
LLASGDKESVADGRPPVRALFAEMLSSYEERFPEKYAEMRRGWEQVKALQEQIAEREWLAKHLGPKEIE